MPSQALNQAFYSIDPTFVIIPRVAIFWTVMAFNLFGEGGDALDPENSR
jgi:peptide/nickel transport system permease protein